MGDFLDWVKPWITKSPTIRQRTVACTSVECGMAFFLKTYKSITTKMTQTVFVESESAMTMYCVSQARSENKNCEHMLIDRWTIKRVADSAVAISINVNILWQSYKAATASAIKAKWLKFYQSRFESWRDRMKELVLMTPYVGGWNKLNSFHSIRIGVDLIEYSDGSKFEVTVRRPKVETKASRDSANLNQLQIVAKYSSSEFKGRLVRPDSIEWDNGSVWIRDGFKRFAGQYTHAVSGETYTVDALGNITMADTGKRHRFQLIASDRISYSYKVSRKVWTHIGTLSIDAIKWQNGDVWKATEKHSSDEDTETDESRSEEVDDRERDGTVSSVESEVGEHVCDERGGPVAEPAKSNPDPEIQETREESTENKAVPMKDQVREVDDDDDDHKDEEPATLTMSATAVAQGELAEDRHDITDFEQEFDHCFETTEEMARMSISINNDEHFVFIEDANSKMFHNVSVNDEWLLI